MGSIQLFPRRAAATPPGPWRLRAIASDIGLRVRAARLEDYAAVRTLQRHAHPGLPTLSMRQLESQRHAFAEGQLVAESDGRIVAAASSLIVRWDDYATDLTWHRITGDGFFTSHDPFGRTLYAMPFIAQPATTGAAAGRALLQAQRRLCRRHNLRRAIVAARLPGYHAVRQAMSPELYARRVIWGDLEDEALRYPLAHGFQFCGIIAHYLPQDADCGGHAALFVWLNPLCAPPGPDACVLSERARNCA